MRIGATTLKVAAGLGTAAAVAGGALAVAADPRPGAAPLRPPVTASASQLTSPALPSDAAGDPLSIPATPVCQRTQGGVAHAPTTTATPASTSGPATPMPTAAPGPVLDPALRALVQQYRAATTRAARQQLLAGLSPDQRMQLTAAIAALRGGAAVPGKAGAATPPVPGGTGQTCRGQGASASGGGAGAAGSVTPTVVAGGGVTPIVTTSVS